MKESRETSRARRFTAFWVFFADVRFFCFLEIELVMSEIRHLKTLRPRDNDLRD